MNSNPTNEEWIDWFGAELKRRFHDRSTAKHYVSDMRLFVRQHPTSLAEVNSHDIAAFVDQQRAAGLAASTVKRRVATLKTFFDFLAETMGHPGRPNPVSVRRHAGRLPQLLPRDLSDSEVERFLDVVDDVRDLAMFGLMLFAGLRVGEVVGLCPGDITETQDGVVPIRLRVMGKGRKERIVYLVGEGYEPLARYLQGRSVADPRAPLFQTRLGSPVTVSGTQERITHYAQLCGIDVTCHRLRHTYARWMAEGEMPVLTLARLLGHSSVHTTQRYIDGADPQLRRSYEAAMERRATRAEEPASTETILPRVVATGPATVIRPEPVCCDGAEMADAPAWLRDSCLDWVQHRWYTWKASQREHHAHTRLRELRLFWKWQLERRPFGSWEELRAEDIAAFMDAQLARGLSAKTVKTLVDRVYEVLRYLQEHEPVAILPQRPALALPEPLPRHLQPHEVLALQAEVAARESKAEGKDWLALALYYLLGHAGLRIGEVLDLKVKDLDLGGRRLWVREGKGRRDRVVLLTSKGCEVLQHYLVTVPHAAGDLVLSWQGRPLDYAEALARVRALGEAAGISGLSPHRLRHTYATQLVNNGMSIEALRRLMGHTNLNTTLIYARLADVTMEQQYRQAMARVTTSQVNPM